VFSGQDSPAGFHKSSGREFQTVGLAEEESVALDDHF